MGRENLKSLTSLRFFAAASIVWLHAHLYFKWVYLSDALPLDHGVSFFFVLSGFILTHAHGQEDLNYGRFMKARVARLWPLHIACLLAVIWFVRQDSQSFDGPGLANKWVALGINSLLLQSWIPTLAAAFSWNSVSWSISTEMFFYAMFPVLLVLMKRRTWAFLAVCVVPYVALWLIARWLQVPPDGSVFNVALSGLFYCFPPSRLMEFGMGMVTCRIWQRLRASGQSGFYRASAIEISALAIVAVWLLFVFPPLRSTAHQSAVFWVWYSNSSSAIFFALFIGMMASGRGVLGRLLAIKPLVFLGETSFALYMVHQIVMKVIFLDIPEMGTPAFVLGACLAAAIMGHLLIERPGRRIVLALGSRPKALHPAVA